MILRPDGVLLHLIQHGRTSHADPELAQLDLDAPRLEVAPRECLAEPCQEIDREPPVRRGVLDGRVRTCKLVDIDLLDVGIPRRGPSKASFIASRFLRSGDTKRSRSWVARGKPRAAIAIEPITTKSTSASQSAAKTPFASSKVKDDPRSRAGRTYSPSWDRSTQRLRPILGPLCSLAPEALSRTSYFHQGGQRRLVRRSLPSEIRSFLLFHVRGFGVALRSLDSDSRTKPGDPTSGDHHREAREGAIVLGGLVQRSSAAGLDYEVAVIRLTSATEIFADGFESESSMTRPSRTQCLPTAKLRSSHPNRLHHDRGDLPMKATLTSVLLAPSPCRRHWPPKWFFVPTTRPPRRGPSVSKRTR